MVRTQILRQRVFIGFITATMIGVWNVETTHAQRGGTGLSGREFNSSIQTNKGFLFVDGLYLEPPYEIRFEETSFYINGTEYGDHDFDLSGYTNPAPAMGRGRGPRGEGSRRSTRNRGTRAFTTIGMLSEDMGSLAFGAIVVLTSERQPMVLWPNQHGHTLLESLLAVATGPTEAPVIPAAIASETDQETWSQLVAEFQPTTAFIDRASTQVEKLNRAWSETEQQLAAIQWRDYISYPLTMVAMVLVVMAVGHLMSNAQTVFSINSNPESATNASGTIIWSLTIVALLSTIDLVWTLLAHQTGSMRELNPIGSKLIDDPAQLVVFKLVITSFSLCLLYWLRELPITRKAIWWCCLVLTLLTARWLTFHSMFI